MNDIKLFLSDVLDGGLTPLIENGDFVSDDGLETPVFISLFSDARVSEEQLPAGESFQRGWWGDEFSGVDQDKIGSRLWTLRREKRTNAVLRKFEDYALESLQWMKEDGIADSITCEASYDAISKYLVSFITIKRPKGTTRYKVNWDKQLVIRS